MMTPRYVIREFKTGRIVGRTDSYEDGFDRCIAMHLDSTDKNGDRKSFHVAPAVAR